MSFSLSIRTAADLAADALSEARAQARAAVRAETQAAGGTLLADYPPAEQLTFPLQTEAAQAYDTDGEAAAAPMLARLDAILAGRGITPDATERAALATRILDRAAAFEAEGLRLAGLRSAAHNDIDAATDIAGIDAALAAFRGAL